MRTSLIGAGLAAAAMLSVHLYAQQSSMPASAPASSFDLYFIGHKIGLETTTVSKDSAGSHFQSAFHFVDRGTAINLDASLDLSPNGQPSHFVVKGRNYRLFTSDAEVTIANRVAHVRDLTAIRDVEFGKSAFFPVDNYAPIHVQQELIKYWIAAGRPASILSAPAGPIRITSRGHASVAQAQGRAHDVERLAIDGVVWGTETAWFDRTAGSLLAITTWAGALPFQAVATNSSADLNALMKDAVADRISDLEALTRGIKSAAGPFALVGATVIDGTDRAPIPNATVVVRNGRIDAVGPSASTIVPRGMRVVDASHQFVIPGLWDMHAHASQVDWAAMYLASGVTTIRDMGGEEGFLVAMRDAVASGKAMGPRYLMAGLIDGAGPRAFGAVSVSTREEAVAAVRRYHAEQFEEIKIYIEMPPALVPVITNEAHRLGMTVTGHVPTGMTSQQVVEAGYDGIAHMQLRGQSGSDASKQQIAFFKAHGTVMDPTESWNELSAKPAAMPLQDLLPGADALPLSLKRMFASMSGGNGSANLVASLRLLKEARDAGLLVVPGTDKGVPGLSLPRELELYVKGGMTPLEALQAGTIVSARAMKLDKESGTIEAGKRADFVVLSADPLADISNVRKIVSVVSNGVLRSIGDLRGAVR